MFGIVLYLLLGTVVECIIIPVFHISYAPKKKKMKKIRCTVRTATEHDPMIKNLNILPRVANMVCMLIVFVLQ